MIQTDEDALICDLAETYGIFDYRQLPADQVAVFAFGLRDDSRIKLAMTNSKVPFETFLLAGVLDRLSALVWFKTTDGQKGINKPLMVAEELTGKTKAKERKEMIFDSGEDFEEYRQKILEKIGGED
ncbi:MULTISPECIES: DUF5361 domain-containing protein [Streptococcus]|uniref:DUF5361 domain-containing protein n=1 Tax=Streptococcus TaxID=1301 RepID=UPI0020C866A5|nr:MULTISPECIES: DUF5361 domain-containing protein [Streptococcus]MCP9069018.1 DUF5361 domain-containing protein [Streptococcus parasanguinis]MCP9082729.1 DUF5361 domain-containing protein [Streptococcus sp. CF10-1]